ncbi:MAG: hypothetical protein A2Y82_05040 [Candidatus Buchananbacteria bacterium RBG_13_36_9]|uniref:Uncharacterized protein n=1 Tax=Candidatus Buchananbacteria bacterium RBG_13_36_9 TaxID=1797530 RepID=A0A1G1XNM7_9BACT|nr:MAG: hypothetical protein A2Y82_05040 [Candidatus Buchananbacteria bacterium RBG_13_36_9]
MEKFRREKLVENELKPKEKKNLAALWCDASLGTQEMPQNVEEMSNQNLKDWMYKSLMKEILIIIEKWGLEPEQELINKIKESKNSSERAKAEEKYILDCHQKVGRFLKQEAPFKEKSLKWDSWPGIMKESEDMNCLGSALIGIELLSRANIKNFIGSPPSHIINIVRLSNGDIWYLDFVNNNVREIDPKVIKIDKVPCLQLEDPNFDFTLIPLFETKDVVYNVISNFDFLKEMVKDDKIQNENIDKQAAIKYYEKFKQVFTRIHLSDVRYKLYSKQIKLNGSVEMRREKERISGLQDMVAKAVAMIEPKLTKEEVTLLIKSIGNNSTLAKDFLLGKKGKLSNKAISPLAAEFLSNYKNNLSKIKIKTPDLYQQIIERFLFKLLKKVELNER